MTLFYYVSIGLVHSLNRKLLKVWSGSRIGIFELDLQGRIITKPEIPFWDISPWDSRFYVYLTTNSWYDWRIAKIRELGVDGSQ